MRQQFAVDNRMEAASLGFRSLELIIYLLNRSTDLENAFLCGRCFLTPFERVPYGIDEPMSRALVQTALK